jgi:hypothetical protein
MKPLQQGARCISRSKRIHHIDYNGSGILQLVGTELRRGVNSEVTPPASYRPGLCAQSTHNLTLKLTEPLAWIICSHTTNFTRQEVEDEQYSKTSFAHERTAPDAALQFNSHRSSLEYNGVL